MSMTSNGRWSRGFAGWICIACVAAVGCDAQVPPGYRGEPLLTLTGSVELTADRPEGPLVPALLFPAGDGSTFEIVDVNVKGTFPSDFVLDVYDPPRTIPKVPAEIGDPPATLGFITAVPKKHAASTILATSSSVGYSAECSSECQDCGPCKIEAMWCAVDDCYYLDLSCATFDTPPDECTVTRMEGNPQLRHPWKMFAGFSSNFIVLYLSRSVSEDSYTARMFHAPHALEAGYHLIEIREYTNDERAERRECFARARQNALDDENERRGTDYSLEEVVDQWCQEEIDGCHSEGAICEPAPPEVPSRLCDRPEEELEWYLDAIDEAEPRIALEMGCALSDWWTRYVEDPAHERIKVTLTPESNPLGPARNNLDLLE